MVGGGWNCRCRCFNAGSTRLLCARRLPSSRRGCSSCFLCQGGLAIWSYGKRSAHWRRLCPWRLRPLVNTQDPASAAAAGGPALQEGQASAAAPELKPVLESIDRLVGDVLAPRLGYDSRLCRVRTRSHAMFTCYPASSPEVKESPGAEGASQSSSFTQSVVQGPALGSGNSFSRGYLRHLDNVRNLDGGEDCGRVLTTILYFNEDWQESHGGALRLFETSTSLQVRAEVLPRLNRLIAFWADEVPHEVLPPRGRDRFACTFWYLDREADPASLAFEKAPAAAAMASAGPTFLD
ncbi:unnamed protein product [Polarella glacialis]|uniref:Fe2OG dioxygenase domain-containing protein n=1 Tax=Polarella glacialis TaxID=89957 RepID=A0A813LUW2_POLGL|nr:unnamed protein product [Polarella glacialis]